MRYSDTVQAANTVVGLPQASFHSIVNQLRSLVMENGIDLSITTTLRVPFSRPEFLAMLKRAEERLIAGDLPPDSVRFLGGTIRGLVRRYKMFGGGRRKGTPLRISRNRVRDFKMALEGTYVSRHDASDRRYTNRAVSAASKSSAAARAAMYYKG